MKLIVYSIICWILGTVLSAVILNSMGNNVNGSAVLEIGMVCFFMPGIYVLSKIYENVKKDNSTRE